MEEMKLIVPDLDQLADRLEHCKTRGIKLYDDLSREFVFLSFAQIIQKAKAVAALFPHYGIFTGDKVLFSAQTGFAFPIFWTACIIASVISVPLAPREAFIAEGAFKNRISEILPFFDKYFCYDNEITEIQETAKEKNAKLETLLLNDFIAKAEAEDRVFSEQISLNDNSEIAFIQFSSGSTSFPKGIMITRGNLLENIRTLSSRWEVDPERTVLGSWLPLYHDMGLVGLLLMSMLTQSNLILLPTFMFIKNPVFFMKTLSDFKVNICCMTNFSLMLILRRLSLTKDKLNDMDLSALSYMGIGAEPVDINILKNFENAFRPYGLKKNVVSPGYGLAESTLAVTVAEIYKGYKESPYGNRIFPTNGIPLAGVEIKVENSVKDSTKKGVIKIRSASVAQNEIINGKKTRIVDDEGFYNTKDLGYFDCGQLVVLGRADNMFIINGENFFPHEVEKIVHDAGILKRARSACFAISASESKTGSTEVFFVYETKPLTSKEKQDIDEIIRKEVSRILNIQLSDILSLKQKTIPMTTSGKIRHKALLRMHKAGQLKNNIINLEKK